MFQSTFLFAVLLLVPTSVKAHGCPKYNSSDAITRAGVLEISDNQLPQPIKAIINKYNDNATVLTGVYDCHSEDGDNEVGMAAVCEPNGTCTCAALYNFNLCTSCSLTSCGGGGNTNNLTIDSFTADCSNVKGGLTETCKVDCGFLTTGCLSPAPAAAPASAAESGMATATTGLLAAAAFWMQY